MMENTVFLLILFYSSVDSFTNELTDLYFEPKGSVFHIINPENDGSVGDIQLTTASNIGSYSVTALLGNIQNHVSFSESDADQDESLELTAHVFNQKVDEKSKSIHFMCRGENVKHSIDLYPSISGIKPTSRCCVISVNVSMFQGYSSCLLEWNPNTSLALCHTFLELPSVLWKDSGSTGISISYSTSKCASCSSSVHSNTCQNQIDLSAQTLKRLTSASLSHAVPDAIREIDQNVLIQIPRGELKLNEEFIVPVRLKRSDDVLEFTVRCEIPSNSYVEFLRVLWPGDFRQQQLVIPQQQLFSRSGTPVKSVLDYEGEAWSKHMRSVRNKRSVFSNTIFDRHLMTPKILSPSAAAPPTSRSATSEAKRKQILWDVFHLSHIINPKRNVTEVVARFREDLARGASTEDLTDQTLSTEVYKLLFRVARPPSGSTGRVAPRIFWSLTSMTRRGSFDVHVGGSPIVTRLSIESLELKHITMVVKTSALVNLAALTGRPTLHPVWVYGLTHDHRLVDVTMRATCHTGDDAVIHFANDSCHRLGFSGAELDGSPGLPLVAKLEGRSAMANLLVWYPKEPALRLQVLDSKVKQSPDVAVPAEVAYHDSQSTPVELKRLPTELNKHGSGQSTWSRQPNDSAETQQFFQHLRICVLARFILAGSILYDKDVLGGRADQYVDVTPYVVHRLRVDSLLDASRLTTVSPLPPPSSLSGPQHPVDLVLTGSAEGEFGPWPSDQLWVLGRRPGRARVKVMPIDRTLVDKAIPPGLAKQLRDQLTHKQHQTVTGAFDSSYQHQSPLHVDLSVNDGLSVWPVGLSAKLVTDFSLEVKKTDAKLSTSGSVRHNQTTSSSRANGHELGGDKSSPAGDQQHLLPVCAGLYTLHVSMQGTAVAHAGSFHPDFTPVDDESSRTRQSASPGIQQQQLVTSVRRGGSAGRRGLLVVWVHMSDGSTVLWNRLLQVYQRTPVGQRASDGAPTTIPGAPTLPFRLTVDSLRPDLFRVENLNGVESRGFSSHQESQPSAGLYPQAYRRLAPNRAAVEWRQLNRRPVTPIGRARRRVLPVRPIAELKAKRSWSAPLVQFLKDEFTVSGDILEVGLQSPSGRLLVPKVRVQGKFRVEHSKLNQASPSHVPPLQVAPSEEGTLLYNSTGRDVYEKSHSHLINTKTAEQHQLIPAEDGPVPHLTWSVSHQFDRYRPDGKSSSSASDGVKNLPLGDQLTQGDERPPTQQLSSSALKISGGNGRYSEPTESSDISSNDQPASLSSHDGKSRGALELSMYILLGLFALVGLVFAVNCGAIVARYRWERVGRQTSHVMGEGQTGIGEGGPAGDSGCQEDGKGGKVADARLSFINMDPERSTVWNRWTRRITRLLGACERNEQSRHRTPLHRDNSWVWIGRSQPSDEQATHLSCGQESAAEAGQLRGSLGPGCFAAARPSAGGGDQGECCQHQLSAIGRPPRGGVATSETTAVLSIGETDLLMHSPYDDDDDVSGKLLSGEDGGPAAAALSVSHRQTGTGGNTAQRRRRKKQSCPDPLVLSPVTQGHIRLNKAGLASGESQTVGRHIHRRYTTDGLLQRNYQGQECSIRIISNPVVPRQAFTDSTAIDPTKNGIPTMSAIDEQLTANLVSACDRTDQQLITTVQSTGFGAHPTSNALAQHVLANQTIAAASQPNNPPMAYHVQAQQLLGVQDLVPTYMLRNNAEFSLLQPTAVGPSVGSPFPLTSAYRPPPPPHKYARGRPYKLTNWSQQPTAGGSGIPVQQQPLLNSDTTGHVMQHHLWQQKNKFKLSGGGAAADSGTLIFDELESDGVHRRASQPYSPCTPTQTRCQTRVYQTLDTRDRNRSGSRRLSPDYRRPRPLSLPQPGYPEQEPVACSRSAQPTQCMSLKPSTSEESLWWYHQPVVRGRRKRYRSSYYCTSGRGQSSGNSLAQQTESLAMGADSLYRQHSHLVGCVGGTQGQLQLYWQQHRTQVNDVFNATLLEASLRTPSLIRSSASSELTWDRDLFALSHDHLMAYFASMKESNA